MYSFGRRKSRRSRRSRHVRRRSGYTKRRSGRKSRGRKSRGRKSRGRKSRGRKSLGRKSLGKRMSRMNRAKQWVKKYPGKTVAAALGTAAVLGGAGYAIKNKDDLSKKFKDGFAKFKKMFTG